jgi:predicted N-formylglutamate amidohydrolase
MQLILSCEHGGNAVPAEYAGLFSSRRASCALAGHRGMDIGALEVAEAMARQLAVPLFPATVTRLLIDLNRSPGHPRLFSEFSRELGGEARRRLVDAHYTPHRRAIGEEIGRRIEAGQAVAHVAVHSFTPRLGAVERRAEIGLLYDPGREPERTFCVRWQRQLRDRDPKLRVRRNYPYLGKADGLTTYLRTRFRAEYYVGIELEINQRLLRRAPDMLAAKLAETLGRVLSV